MSPPFLRSDRPRPRRRDDRRPRRPPAPLRGDGLALDHPDRLPRRLGIHRFARMDRSVLLFPADGDRRPVVGMDDRGHGRRAAVVPLVGHHGGEPRRLLLRRHRRHRRRHRARPQSHARRHLLDLHQGDQLDPARRAGADLHHDLRSRPRLEGGAVLRHGVLRRLLQRLPGGARGRPQHDRQCPDPRRLPIGSSPAR